MVIYVPAYFVGNGNSYLIRLYHLLNWNYNFIPYISKFLQVLLEQNDLE